MTKYFICDISRRGIYWLKTLWILKFLQNRQKTVCFNLNKSFYSQVLWHFQKYVANLYFSVRKIVRLEIHEKLKFENLFFFFWNGSLSFRMHWDFRKYISKLPLNSSQDLFSNHRIVPTHFFKPKINRNE